MPGAGEHLDTASPRRRKLMGTIQPAIRIIVARDDDGLEWQRMQWDRAECAYTIRRTVAFNIRRRHQQRARDLGS